MTETRDTLTRLFALQDTFRTAFVRAYSADDQLRMDALLARMRHVSSALARIAQGSAVGA